MTVTANVLFVTHCVPQRDVSGGAMTCWALLKQLLDKGYKIHVVFLQESLNEEISNERQMGKLLDDFPLLSHVVLNVPGRSKIHGGWKQGVKALLMTRDYLLPSFLLKERLEKILQGGKFDLILNYHYAAAASTFELSDIPQMTITGDLLCQPIIARWRLLEKKISLGYVARTFRVIQAVLKYRNIMVKLLNKSNVAGSFGYHDAAWLKSHGVLHSEHFYSPIKDDYLGAKAPRDPSRKLKIIAGVSNLGSTSTHAALLFIVAEILPILERELGNSFEIHVIGQGDPPKQLLAVLPRETVVLRGFVHSVEEEFNTADIMLQPTPVFIGFRIRIIKAFCHALCVVTHKNDTINMPEIVHGENALVGGSGLEIANLLISVIRDRDFREKIARGGRRTYEAYYLPEKATQKIIDKIKSVMNAKGIER